MSFYIFEASSECLTFTPTSLKGEMIGNDIDDVPLDRLNAVKVRLIEPQTILPDRLSVGTKRFIVLRSHAADDLIARHDFPKDLRKIPAQVQDPSGTVTVADDFVLLTSNCEFDVLSRGKAKYISVTRSNGLEIVVSVKTWCIDPRNCPTLDAFPVMPNDWMVSEAFKWTYEAEGFSGAVFTKVDIDST